MSDVQPCVITEEPSLPPGLVSKSARRTFRRANTAAKHSIAKLEARVCMLECLIAKSPNVLPVEATSHEDASTSDTESPDVSTSCEPVACLQELSCDDEFYGVSLSNNATQTADLPFTCDGIVQTDLSFPDTSLLCHVVEDSSTMVHTELSIMAHNCLQAHNRCHENVANILAGIPDTTVVEEVAMPVEPFTSLSCSSEQKYDDEDLIACAELVRHIRLQLVGFQYVFAEAMEYLDVGWNAEDVTNGILFDLPMDEDQKTVWS